jgi:hypothetical protein
MEQNQTSVARGSMLHMNMEATTGTRIPFYRFNCYLPPLPFYAKVDTVSTEG